MGTTTMPESSHGAWWAYPIYAAGIAIGAMSPEQWLIALSLVAVIIRIIIDLPNLCASLRRLFGIEHNPTGKEPK